MTVNVQVQNFELSSADEEYASTKLAKLKRFAPIDTDDALIQANFHKHNGQHNADDLFGAELRLDVGPEHYVATARAADFRAAVDKAEERLRHEVVEARDKQRAKERRG